MLKNKSLGFYSGCAAVILSAAAMVLYFLNISNAYFADAISGTVVACTAAAILMIIAYIALDRFGRSSDMADFCRGLLPVGATFPATRCSTQCLPARARPARAKESN